MPEYQENCTVQEVLILNKPNSAALDNAFCRLTVRAQRIAGSARPGQFVMATCGRSCDPLLRRPFSIHRILGQETLQLLIRVVGQGSGNLATLQPGDQLDLLGPLGHGFQYTKRKKTTETQAQTGFGLFDSLIRSFHKKNSKKPLHPVCLVGGGIGIAPLLFLADQILPNLGNADRKRCVVLLGGRTKGEIAALAEEFGKLGCTLECATDDGSFGVAGMVTTLLPPHLGQMEKVYCCGPHAMMAAVAAQCREAHVACEVSLEANMACGLGACLGCTVHGSAGAYLHVCKKGPVVAAKEVLWSR